MRSPSIVGEGCSAVRIVGDDAVKALGIGIGNFPLLTHTFRSAMIDHTELSAGLQGAL